MLTAGPHRDCVMRFIQVPELTVVPSDQRYEPLGDRVVRFSSGSFTADITFDEEGFVTLYDGFLELISG
ncbi:MAG: putative glycolipid-binding domain-containing protein [Actinomycetota bacterium]